MKAQCRRCGAVFERGSRGSQGRQCAPCVRAYQRMYYHGRDGNPPLDKGWKRCPGCGVLKSRVDYGPHKNGADGRASWCRACTQAATEIWKQRRLGGGR